MPGGIKLMSTMTYKDHQFTDVSTKTDDGRYRARVVITTLDGGFARSQRFLDMETYPTAEAARKRVIGGAMGWLDANAGEDRLMLPINIIPAHSGSGSPN